MRREMAKKERNSDIVEKFMKNIELLQEKYIKTIDPADLEEVSRRLALLKPPFIAECVECVSSTLQCLNIPVSSAVLAARARRIIELRTIIIPKIGASRCTFVRERIAELISLTIKHIKNERIKTIKEYKIQESEAEAETEAEGIEEKSTSPLKIRSTVVVSDSAEIIGESQYSEFIGDLAEIPAKRRISFVRDYSL